ncbi:MAG: DNA-directed RNA polymerase subunit alpha [Candidatus Saganbacteria bacterium]|nr:DNA-directed RNA polymerase subunit alpha [Candidatus Saganbacteria bacterium]
MVMIGEKPWVRHEMVEDGYGRFIVEPLERGYGSTLGNSMRRVLLSSLVGAAVTSIRIEEVSHEFSTIPNVVEDVLQIILNIKKMIVRSHSDAPKIIKLEAKGKGVVKAGDIKHDADVEIVDPEHYLATLESGGELNIEMVVEKGRGFVPSERNKKPNQPIGTIPVDSIFSPVKKVNVTTEEVRVGQEINYDRLILDVWTNKAVKPEDAVKQSAEVLAKHINMFIHIGERSDALAIHVPGEGEVDPSILEMNIDDIDLSSRSLNCLKKASINTVGELIELTENDLLKIKSLGTKSFDEIKESLAKFNLILKGGSLSGHGESEEK